VVARVLNDNNSTTGCFRLRARAPLHWARARIHWTITPFHWARARLHWTSARVAKPRQIKTSF